MIDKEGRIIDYLRISVTDRCNLRCVYCMPEEGIKNIGHDQILSYEEIVHICRILAEHGLKKIKITGGEPLVRREIVRLIRNLKAIDGIENVTITTNGVLLEEYYDSLVEAGIDAITVSLDTMDPELYRQITRRDAFSQVMAGIHKAVREGSVRLKINCVLTGKTEEQDILSLLDFAKRSDVDVRFIEMMPIGLGKQFSFVSEESIRKMIEDKYGAMVLYCEKRGNGPCKYYDVPGFIGKVGFISAVSHKFCDTCNRVRLTAEGFLKTCLQFDCGVHLGTLLKEHASDEELWKAMEAAIYAKPKSHHFEERTENADDESRAMSQIGG